MKIRIEQNIMCWRVSHSELSSLTQGNHIKAELDIGNITICFILKKQKNKNDRLLNLSVSNNNHKDCFCLEISSMGLTELVEHPERAVHDFVTESNRTEVILEVDFKDITYTKPIV